MQCAIYMVSLINFHTIFTQKYGLTVKCAVLSRLPHRLLFQVVFAGAAALEVERKQPRITNLTRRILQSIGTKLTHVKLQTSLTEAGSLALLAEQGARQVFMDMEHVASEL